MRSFLIWIISAAKLGVVALAVGLPTVAPALEYEVTYTDNRPIFPPAIWVEMTGAVENGDTVRFLEAIRPYAGRDVYEVVISIDSPGGSLVESLRLGRAISELPYTTRASIGVEGQPQTCASACVNVYLGADYRFLSDNARIGVHRFSMSGSDVGADEAISISQGLSAQIVEHMRAMRADPEFFSIMVSAHAQDIYWVPKEKLEELRVVTGSVFSEVAEYRNINGAIALHLSQISQVGTNELTLVCGDRGLIGIFDLNEPELAWIGSLELYVDGTSLPLDDFEVIDRSNFRIKLVSLLSPNIQRRLATAKEIGGRVTSPSGMFFGFEGGVSDPKIAETARGCVRAAEVRSHEMKIEEDTDFTGGDITQSGFRDVSFAECQRICLGNSECVAVSYVVARRWCWPKDRILSVNRNAGVISAYRN